MLDYTPKRRCAQASFDYEVGLKVCLQVKDLEHEATKLAKNTKHEGRH